ncbi:MAG TPA: hypothetical protein VHE08_00955 [Solirubrobacterales bacterium]|nr:hypothetical protein [Solirubrobacterales bacterium]
MTRLRLRRAILAVTVFCALVLPATASAATPRAGHYAGDGVSFDLVHHGVAGSWVRDARYHGHSDFEPAVANPHHHHRFTSCSRVLLTPFSFREFCIDGSFVSADRAGGSVSVYSGSGGRRAPRPYETHHWTAVLTG